MLTADRGTEVNEEPEESCLPIRVGDEQVSSDVVVSVVAECVVRELIVVFDRLPAAVVTAVVLEAERDLAGQVTDGSFAELLHRLAAFQLEQLHVEA